MSKRSVSVGMFADVPAGGRALSASHDGALGWAERYGAIVEALKAAQSANRRLWVICLALIVVCGVLYKSTRVVMFAREVDANGVALRTTQLERVSEASDVMKRDAVIRFFRGLRSATQDVRYQEHLSRTALALTAGGSAAHQTVEAFGEVELPKRRELEIDAQVVAHPLSEGKWRADIIETDRNGQRSVFTAYVTLEVAVEADRNVDLNPWGVFVRGFSIDAGGER